ncbi:MAG TPA: hypothetical protein VMV72_09300 [Verrucomicrobiae bacterium]|nr:hypothetical protein [Verrucomicrobiae bacterium]
MLWSTLLSPIRIGISIVLGMMVAAIITLNFWNDRPGDDPSAIREATAVLDRFHEHAITNSIARLISGMKIEQLTDPSAAVITAVAGKVVTNYPSGSWLITVGDGRKYVVKASQPPAADAFAPYIQRVAMDGPWKNLDDTIDRLTRQNGLILRAKALTYLDRKPESESSQIWDDRFVLATSEYGVYTDRARLWQTIVVGLCALVLSAFGSWALVVFLPLLWQFLVRLRRAAQRPD